MKPFLNEDFLLNNQAAVRLYHAYASDMPIFDYHCHLPVKEIAEDRRFKTITEVWLAGDHYKWRAMRANGIEEAYITGHADDYAKFQKWAETVPAVIRNPLYHWTHMELKKTFGIAGKVLNPDTAEEIYTACNALLQTDDFTARGLIRKARVEILCTTDDPTDDLAYHRALAADPTFPVTVLPAFRPDKVLNIGDAAAFNAWIDKLATVTSSTIDSYAQLLTALEARIRLFHITGCRTADHGLEVPYSADFDKHRAAAIFLMGRNHLPLTWQEILEFRSAVMFELGVFYHQYGWAMQLHMGPIRNTNTARFNTLGPDTGFDTIGDHALAIPLYRFLDRLAANSKLPKTILYSINPADNDMLATLIGCFQEAPAKGKIQFGAAWWFNDNKQGIIDQLNALSRHGLLSRFIGMLTDSRSFLSYARHDYFRRILCNLLGTDVENGELPADFEGLGKIVQDICFYNAIHYFGASHANHKVQL